ncbi:MAG TPA: hypothetical protein VFY25_04370 [Anaerolineales bacterium]|nr:hypothetical protein [Anaerolineales bacterium]
MDRTRRSILFLTLLIAILAISTSVVFAKELGLLTISGPGIKGEVTLKDPEAMMGLEQAGFFDQAVLAKPPKDLGEGYDITAHLNLDGKMTPYIEMVYYPTKEGQSGYIHYTGRLNGEALQTVDEWHLLNRTADGALRDLLTANNITVQSALITAPAAVAPAKEPAKEPASAPAAEPVKAPAAPAPAPGLIIALVAGILALTVVALAVRRRTVSHPTT